MQSNPSDIKLAVGHPGERWQDLIGEVRRGRITRFADVSDQWLDLMWCLDTYRVSEVVPEGMGDPAKSDERRLEGIYRGKGNWFATLLADLLSNQTGELVAPRTDIPGFSQYHQIDIAWPAEKDTDPQVCADAKLSGAPAHGSTVARGATSDWSNRRRELKFTATDLKLHRRKEQTQIDHWGNWRDRATPKVYVLWGARLRDGETIDKMAEQAQVLASTYLNGAGIVAWRETVGGQGYELEPLHPSVQSFALDDTLWEMASEISGRRTG